MWVVDSPPQCNQLRLNNFSCVFLKRYYWSYLICQIACIPHKRVAYGYRQASFRSPSRKYVAFAQPNFVRGIDDGRPAVRSLKLSPELGPHESANLMFHPLHEAHTEHSLHTAPHSSTAITIDSYPTSPVHGACVSAADTAGVSYSGYHGSDDSWDIGEDPKPNDDGSGDAALSTQCTSSAVVFSADPLHIKMAVLAAAALASAPVGASSGACAGAGAGTSGASGWPPDSVA
jgi:hypothetical protein